MQEEQELIDLLKNDDEPEPVADQAVHEDNDNNRNETQTAQTNNNYGRRMSTETDFNRRMSDPIIDTEMQERIKETIMENHLSNDEPEGPIHKDSPPIE